MSDLLKLAERVEGGNAEMHGRLLEEAWDAMAKTSADFRRFATAYVSGFDNNAGKFAAALEAGAYLSAAVLLVPEGSDWSVSSEQRMGVAFCIDKGIFAPDTIAQTPALALTAAALRARAAQEQQP